MDLPSFYRIRQRFDATSLSDVAASVRAEFSKLDLTSHSHGNGTGIGMVGGAFQP